MKPRKGRTGAIVHRQHTTMKVKLTGMHALGRIRQNASKQQKNVVKEDKFDRRRALKILFTGKEC